MTQSLFKKRWEKFILPCSNIAGPPFETVEAGNTLQQEEDSSIIHSHTSFSFPDIHFPS